MPGAMPSSARMTTQAAPTPGTTAARPIPVAATGAAVAATGAAAVVVATGVAAAAAVTGAAVAATGSPTALSTSFVFRPPTSSNQAQFGGRISFGGIPSIDPDGAGKRRLFLAWFNAGLHTGQTNPKREF